MTMRVIFLVSFFILLAACEPQSRTEVSDGSIPSLQAWLDAPLPNSTIPLSPYILIFHGADASGVDEFEVHVNGILEASIPVNPSAANRNGENTLFFGEYPWKPPAPGTYLIAVYAKSQGVASSPAQVQVEVIDDPLLPLQTETPTQQGQPPPPPTDEPTPAVIQPQPPSNTPATEQRTCTFTAKVDVFCRLGPGVIYAVVDSINKDQTAIVVGASTAGYHWYVIGPRTGEVCAVSSDDRYGSVEGSCGSQPQFTPPPTPIFTFTPTTPSRSAPTDTPASNRGN